MTEKELIHDEMVDALKAKGLKRFTPVWTADDVRVGQAIRFHHRTHDVNPELKLYASYLESNAIKMGGPIFIPTTFIADYDPAEDKVILTVDFGTVKKETWDRTPGFIAHRTSEIEELTP